MGAALSQAARLSPSGEQAGKDGMQHGGGAGGANGDRSSAARGAAGMSDEYGSVATRGGGGGGGLEVASPSPVSGRSPLTYSPQVPTSPLPRGGNGSSVSLPRGGRGTTSAEGAGGEGTVSIPTVLTWTHGGERVEVEGSYDNWSTRTPLHRSGTRDFAVVKLLPPGVYQYKFIVDGTWRYAPDLPAAYDEMGNVNNVAEVQEFAPENTRGIEDVFGSPPSPPSSYDCPGFADAQEFAREPGPAPPHLQLTLLNVPAQAGGSLVATGKPGGGSRVQLLGAVPCCPLPRPAHVILNHVYIDKASGVRGVTVLGTTHRYKSKYVTSLHYKSIS